MKLFLKNKNNFFAKNHCEIQVHTILVCTLYSIKNSNYMMEMFARLKHSSLLKVSMNWAQNRLIIWVAEGDSNPANWLPCPKNFQPSGANVIKLFLSVKHSSLVWKLVIYGRKKFYNIGPWCQICKTFFLSHWFSGGLYHKTYYGHNLRISVIS